MEVSALRVRAAGFLFLFFMAGYCRASSSRAREMYPALPSGMKSDVSPTSRVSYEWQVAESLPEYKPEQSVSGTIRLSGHGSFKIPWLKPLVARWEEGFRRYQPGVTIEYDMRGTSSAIPGLFTGKDNLAILGEEVDPVAAATFEKVKHYPPTSISIMTGSLDVRNFDYAQMFFVHKGNPISRLTLAQLDAIFGSEHRRGLKNIRTWGDLGLTGIWAGKPIHVYGWRIDDSFGIFLEQALLGGSHHWNCDLREYSHIYRPDGTIYDHGQQILDALANDPYGIAVSNIRYAGPDVEPLALAATNAGPYYQANKETLIEQKYPLTRLIPAVVDREQGTPIDPKVKEFLRYILSRQGQEAIVEDGRYLPLNKDAAAQQLKKLE